MPGVAFPPVGPVGDSSPPSSVLCSAKTALRPVSGCFARRSLPDTLLASARSCCPCWARGRVEALRPRQGLWSPGPPVRVCRQGERWLSQVPELPLWRYAPLSDPGGVLRTCQSAPRTAAFRCVQTVGVPLDTPEGIFVTPDSTHFGALSRGLPPHYPRLRTPSYEGARGFVPDLLARL